MKTITIIENVNTDEYFFTTDHCQKMNDPDWIPTTFYLPMKVAPRKGLEDGMIKDKDGIRILESLIKEIPNPDKNLQA